MAVILQFLVVVILLQCLNYELNFVIGVCAQDGTWTEYNRRLFVQASTGARGIHAQQGPLYSIWRAPPSQLGPALGTIQNSLPKVPIEPSNTFE